MKSPTFNSSVYWLQRHPLQVHRFLRHYFEREDHSLGLQMLYESPDEGVKLIKNFHLSNNQKIKMFVKWIVLQPQITCAVFGDQRMGKDATITYLIERALDYAKKKNISSRVVSLGNIKAPPYVAIEDMYFSFQNVPWGGGKKEVWIYSSELENVLPARKGGDQENMLYNHMEGTMAQNRQKLFGCIKLAYKVDINVVRSLNTKIFKFISEDKLKVEGVEREGMLSGLGRLLLPKNRERKSECLLVFNNNLLTLNLPLPSFWSDGYSEQFRDIPESSLQEFVKVQSSNGMSFNDIETAIKQKFRRQIPVSTLKSWL